ncbi:MAG: MerR family transcriptional regulator [Herpetosiphonaceae bacterium]|nr:MerR family transcriptional regulator [Herpetosiphonaceae bacterium]
MLDQLRHLLTLPDTPLYNIKVVVGQSGINASTLRAWERRYNIPVPQRSDHGFRLYSPRDVAILTWMREQTEQGMTAHQAVSLIEQVRTSELDNRVSPPAEGLAQAAPAAAKDQPALPAMVQREQRQLRVEHDDLAQLTNRLLAAFGRFDLRSAHDVTNQALAAYSSHTVLTRVFAPALVRLGDGWARRESSAIIEHAASNFCRQRILALMQQNAPFCLGPRVVCGCVPDEHHELGLLMFSLLLQQHGWDVVYLGQSITLEGLDEALRTITPILVCFTANLIDNIPSLIEVGQIVDQSGLGVSAFVYGGRIFDEQPDLCQHIPGTYLGTSLDEAVLRCSQLAQESIERTAKRVLDRPLPLRLRRE